MIYLASPYSHPDKTVKEERFKEVCRVAAGLMAQGHVIFSPIAHTHPIALAGDLPGNWEYWERFDMEFIKASESLMVLRLDGWEQSVGVQAEIKIAEKLGKPISYI